MLLKKNLLTVGLIVVLSVSGQSAIAGGRHFGGNGGGFHGNLSSSALRVSTPKFNVQPSVGKSFGNGIQPSFKTQHFQPSFSKPLLQTGKFNPGLQQLHTGVKLGLPQGNFGKGSNSLPKIGKLPVLPIQKTPTQVLKGGIKFPGKFDFGKVNPIIPIKPIHPICPPQGGKFCGTGYGGCWGNNCGFGWNWGGCNWGYGGCGYWPGYFGNCCTSYPYPYPYQVCYTPTYFCSTPVVEVVPASTTTVVLSDMAVPPAPAVPAAAPMQTIDLAVKEVRVVEAATDSRGALYRVTIMNKGPMNLEMPTRVAALGIKDSQPDEKTPRAIETLQGLNSGATKDIDLRMPVAANAMPRLLVAVEIPDNVKDTDEMNNVVAGEVAQLPQVAAK